MSQRTSPQFQRLLTLLPAARGADHIDMKSGEGEATLRECIAGMFSYTPGWVRLLFRVRGVLAKVLGLRHEDVWTARVRPQDVPFTPGERLRVFEVETASEAMESAHWIATGRDTHLDASIVVLAEPLGEARRRFFVYTVVTYKRWTGPLYFTLILPFHHLLVAAMLQAALRSQQR